MIIVDIRTAMIAHIAAAVPSAQEVKPHGGRFSLDELRAIAARSPSVRVACLGISSIKSAPTGVHADVAWGAFVVCGDRPQLPRDSMALGMVGALATIVPLNAWGYDDRIDGARQVRADNLFSRDLARHGVALWAVTWRHTVDLNPADLDTLDDFMRAHVDVDIDNDGTVDITDEIALPQ